jgi:arylsulfatase A-like enzyme
MSNLRASTRRTLLGLALLGGCGFLSAPSAPDAPDAEVAGKGARKGKKAKADPAVAVAPKPALSDALRASPNVLLIVWDTVRADRMSLYGYDKPTTPKTDAWAQRGTVYDRAVSPGVWTLPSHASMFTGLPERAHGVSADHNWLDSAHETIAETLSATGYDTWVFCSNPYLAKDTNLLQGFDKQEFPWDKAWMDKVGAHMKGKLDPRDASTAVSPAFTGKAGADSNRYLYKEAGPVAADALGAWLDARAEPERPFFGFINLMEAHLPRIPSLAARQAVMRPEAIERAWHVEQSTTYFHEWMVGVRSYDPLDLEAISGVYDASLIDLDAATAFVFDLIQARGLAEDTAVILTSDHGENLGDHDLLLHKYGVHNSLARVPLVVVWPGTYEAVRVSDPKSVADVLVDVLDRGRAPIPDARKAALAGRPQRAAQGVVAEFSAVADGSVLRMKKLHPDASTARLERTFLALEQGPLKVIEASDGGVELFDVVADPAESHNLASSRPADVSRMRALVEAWRAAVPPWTPTGEASGHKRSDELKKGLEAIGYVE